MKARWSLLRVTLVGVLVVAAVVASGAARGGTAQADDAIVVTRDALELPNGCTPRAVASLVDRFFDAIGRGDWVEVDAFLAPSGSGPTDFKLFSWGRDVVYERGQVVRFLDVLRTSGERFRLLSLHATKQSGSSSSVAVSYLLERPRGVGTGKGLIGCESGRIWQLAMAPATAHDPLVLPCPKPRGWSRSGPIVACTGGPNAPALAPGFRTPPSALTLPPKCGASVVRRKIVVAVSAFNSGLGDVVASMFVPGKTFRPYTASFRMPFSGRKRIASFVGARYSAGDGWTATRLLVPRRKAGLPAAAAYGVDLQVRSQGSQFGYGRATFVVDCRSGLLRRWTGPTVRMPPA